MGLELLNVDHAQPGRGQSAPGGQERQVRVVLVVDRVELTSLHEAKKVGKLQGHQTGVLHQGPETRREVPDVRDMGEHIVRSHQVGTSVALGDRSAGRRAEELDHRADAPRLCDLGHILCRLDSEDGNALGNKMLQEIAVVARHLGDQTVLGESELRGHGVCVPLGVGHPRVRVGREVGVVGEDVLSRHVRRKLYEEARRALAHVQRIEDLRLVERIRRDIALAQRRHPKVDETSE